MILEYILRVIFGSCVTIMAICLIGGIANAINLHIRHKSKYIADFKLTLLLVIYYNMIFSTLCMLAN